MSSQDVVVAMYDKSQNEAGPKAKRDIEKFLAAEDFQIKDFYFKGARKAQLISIKQSWWDIPHQLTKLAAKHVFFQYPSFNLRTDHAILQAVRKSKAQVYLIVHDVVSLQQANNQEKRAAEIDFFNQTDGLIVHNHKMKDWLGQHGVIVPMVELEIFDYDNPQPFLSLKYERTVCYAGNLLKAGFLKRLTLQHQLNLFGPNPQADYPQNIVYQGSFLPEELPLHLNGNFGLVWDGDKIERCAGLYGEYLKYNDPHKTSLYLSSGLPIIIWAKAALADFVRKYQVGLLIDDLNELDALLATVSEKDYRQLCDNARKVGTKMRRGDFIKAACHQMSRL